jgi:hypothetical protein
MVATFLYRIASVLLLLFAVGNTFVFRRTETGWGVDPVVGSMRHTRFEIQGLSRTFWDFYTGYGLFASVLLLFAAVLAWQLGSLTNDQLRSLPGATWGLAICLLSVAVLSWKYFLISTGAFATLIALMLLLAAILAR